MAKKMRCEMDVRSGMRQVYGPRTGWTFPPHAPENCILEAYNKIPYDAVEGTNPGDLIVTRQDGATRWVRIR